MARRRYGEVTSGSGKSHQGRRITMAQPVSSIFGDLVKSSRSIAHSDDFEGHKLIQTNSRQLILLDLNILYWCPMSRDQIKTLLVQPQISCNANGLAVANPTGVSRPYLPPAPNKATETVIFFFGKMFAPAAAAAWGSSMRKQQRQQQQRQQEAAGGRQQQAAASSSKQQQAAGKQASSRQAAGKQQPAFAPLKE